MNVEIIDLYKKRINSKAYVIKEGFNFSERRHIRKVEKCTIKDVFVCEGKDPLVEISIKGVKGKAIYPLTKIILIK